MALAKFAGSAISPRAERIVICCMLCRGGFHSLEWGNTTTPRPDGRYNVDAGIASIPTIVIVNEIGSDQSICLYLEDINVPNFWRRS
jgi:hypothetical protein